MNAKLPTPTPEAKHLRAQSFNAAMTARPGELELHIPAADIEGSIPPALFGGRVLSNGPGWTRIGDWTAHPFDGHGYLRAFELGEDGCKLRARFVETEVYQREAQTERMQVRGFATNLPGPPWRNWGFGGSPRNVANTTIVRWGDALLAGWEGGLPHALDPDSLATRGPEDFGGAIAGRATLAHMHCDAARERLLLCSVSMSRETKLCWREIDARGVVHSEFEVGIPGMMFIHDFCFTDSYYIVGANTLRFAPAQLAKLLVGRSTLLHALATQPAKSNVLYLIPRDGSGPVRTVTLPGPTFVVHFGNAFERDGTIYVDTCAFPDFEFGHEFGYQGPHAPFDPALPDQRVPQRVLRIEIPAGASEASWQPLSEYAMDFPRIHPDHEGRETPWLFGGTRADTRYSDPFDSLLAIDLRDPERPSTLWKAPDNVFVGEPLFAPDPAQPDAGHLLAILSDGLRERSDLAIFDATCIDAGPVARIPMPLLPIAFHGDFEPPADAR